MNCRVCNSSNLEMVLDLGDQPHCNTLISPESVAEPEPHYPLRLCFCHECATAQIDHTVPKETMFSTYPYVSGTTQTLRKHFEDSARRLVTALHLETNDLVVDIGSNDGTWLKSFKRHGLSVLGVEPAGNLVALAQSDRIDTLERFFNAKTAAEILAEYGTPALVTAAGVFFHLEELHSASDGIALFCDRGATFCVQAIYLGEMLAKNHFDNIYHEHLTYWSLTSISRLFDMHGLEVFQARIVPIHGGTLELLVAKKGSHPIEESVVCLLENERTRGIGEIDIYRDFAATVRGVGRRLMEILQEFSAAGKSVHALGAPAKGATLLNTFGISTDLVACATERNPLKIGQLMPGCRIPIVDEAVVDPPDAYLVLPWNFMGEFLAKNRDYIMDGGTFIVPLPEPHLITRDNYTDHVNALANGGSTL